jgi:hypothetical protein
VQTAADIFRHAPIECCKDDECHRQVCEWYESAVEITGTGPRHHQLKDGQDVATTHCCLRPTQYSTHVVGLWQCWTRPIHVGRLADLGVQGMHDTQDTRHFPDRTLTR